ncbi:hypothetical protein ZIOFF_018521 [Zingiber officinale]|uniref:Uncharacterized protein n=1 Tax=Zingiber officinale TaxID=94328 RepID=A0A8J5H8B9_ZINOF|nr:hypothetical protein ZIOFF_018521 [Zingiber officinale]
MPIPPSAYLAIGCVAHPGNQPPPNHIVYCLHFDLVTSTKFSSCISLSSPSSRAPSAFSIWHVHYVVGSFYAHNSMDCPPSTESFDLHQILLCNPDDIYSKEIADKEPQYQQFEFLWMGYFENFIRNKLGCDMHLREFEQNSETTKFLQHNGHVSLFFPTPRFLDKLNVVANSRESSYYVAI